MAHTWLIRLRINSENAYRNFFARLLRKTALIPQCENN